MSTSPPILAMAAALSLLSALGAAEPKPKPNSLTPKEIAEGWILLFDGETTFGWKPEGEVSVKDGTLKLGGEKAASITSNSVWNLCELKLEFAGPKTTSLRISFNMPSEMSLKCSGIDQWFEWKYQFLEPTRIGTTLSQNGTWLTSTTTKPMSTAYPTAPVRLAVKAGEEALVRSIKLRPLVGKSLFNGKDLDGWKVYPDPKRQQSKWSVTPEGWLNVKNGPGDLQTTGKYDDFVLQLECISNGKALNSGIFFRCIDNEYQNGYEMQIQNGFKDNDRAKPADFGTGAIYRRIAARKVVPNDQEWFAMTLNAHGNHFATWVNGYQTIDWTDDRSPDPNPRKGLRTAAGHLSIQGHDPTTDLSFRNIRIADLKQK